MIVFILFIGISLFITFVVPINMDESFQYHLISCSFYEQAQYHVFREPCDSTFDLNLWGLTLKRTYIYAGSLSSFLYSPFFHLLPTITTQRVIGILFGIPIILCAINLEKENRKATLLLFALSYPLTYQLICDTGPVRYSLLIFFLTPLLAQKIIKNSNRIISSLLCIALGFLIFLGVEDKPFFVYLLPLCRYPVVGLLVSDGTIHTVPSIRQ